MREVYCALVIYLSAIAYFVYEVSELVAEALTMAGSLLVNLPMR